MRVCHGSRQLRVASAPRRSQSGLQGSGGGRRGGERPTSTSDTRCGGETVALQDHVAWYHQRDATKSGSQGAFSPFEDFLLKYNNSENNWEMEM